MKDNKDELEKKIKQVGFKFIIFRLFINFIDILKKRF